MEQYIPKSALVAEIENLETTYKKCPTRNSYEDGLKDGRLIGYNRKEFLEHYGWDGLRCKAAVAAMQGFIINGINDVGSKEDNMKYLVSVSVQVATALVKELQETT